MLNLFRMDSRRLFQSRTFYIIMALVVALIAFICLTLAIISSPEVLDAMEQSGADVEAVDYQVGAEIAGMSQLTFVHQCLSSGFLLILTGMGMTFFVGNDFTGGYIKNICFARPHRWEYVAAKALIGGVYSGIITVLGVLFSLVLPPLFGLRPTASGIGDIVSYTFWIWLPIWVFSLMALTMVLITRSVSLGILMSVLCGGGIPALMVGMFTGKLGWPRIENYFVSSLVNSCCMPQAGMEQIWVILASVAGWSALYIAGSLLLTKNRDI